jgi:hypothetical protein
VCEVVVVELGLIRLEEMVVEMVLIEVMAVKKLVIEMIVVQEVVFVKCCGRKAVAQALIKEKEVRVVDVNNL